MLWSRDWTIGKKCNWPPKRDPTRSLVTTNRLRINPRGGRKQLIPRSTTVGRSFRSNPFSENLARREQKRSPCCSSLLSPRMTMRACTSSIGLALTYHHQAIKEAFYAKGVGQLMIAIDHPCITPNVMNWMGEIKAIPWVLLVQTLGRGPRSGRSRSPHFFVSL